MPRRSTKLLTVAFALCLLAPSGACSSSSDRSAKAPVAGGSTTAAETTTSTSAAPATRPGEYRKPACAVSRAQTEVPAATPMDASGNADLTSFDGTSIRIHWFPNPNTGTGSKSPTVLMGPGWGSPGDTNTGQTDPNGALLSVYGVNIPALWQQGYNVLTWDPRGFGMSGGTVEVDDAAYEGRDVQRLLNWVAAQPQVQLDGEGDPRVGMVGGSYGGGIQLVTAAIDCRVDVIAPEIAWNSLQTSLYKADTVKIGWAGLLYSVAGSHTLDPHIEASFREGTSTGRLSAANVQFYAERGLKDLIGEVRVPTLFLQGTVDTLFTLDEAARNVAQVRKNAPTAMVWFCGGHGFCLTDPGDKTRVTRATFAWLQRYLKDDTSAPELPVFDTIDQDGTRFTGGSFPLPAMAPITAKGSGTLSLTAQGGSGPATAPPGNTDILAATASITPAKAANAVNVGVTWSDRNALVVGAPKLSVTYTGSPGSGDKPTRVFAQLVDDNTGLVLGNQVTPLEVTLDGKSHNAEVPLEMVAFSAKPGASLTLQLVPTTVAYAQPQVGGRIDFAEISVELPVVKADVG